MQRTAWTAGINHAQCTKMGRAWADPKPVRPSEPLPPSPPSLDVVTGSRLVLPGSHDYIFETDGENATSWDMRRTEEQIRRDHFARYDEAMATWRRDREYYKVMLRKWEVEIVEWEKRNRVTHRVPDIGCVCCFYALSDPANPEFEVTTGPGVWGVMEGFGKTLLGEKGFRCEKGRILAVVVPPAEPTGNTAGGFDFDFDVEERSGWSSWASGNRRRVEYVAEDKVQADLFYKHNAMPADLVERVQAKYPEVAIYPSKRALLAEFGVDA